MKKITILIAIISLFTLVNAQISDSYHLTPSDLTIQRNSEYDLIKITNEHNFTNEIGKPQLPIKIISYVLPYNSTVTGITINSLIQEKLSGNYYIFPAQPPILTDGSEPLAFVEPNLEIYDSSTSLWGLVNLQKI